MPALAFALTVISGMSEYPQLSTMIMGSCPGGNLSNVVTFWVNGNLSLSIVMSTCSSILSMGVMPLLMYLYSLYFSSLSEDGVQIDVPFDEIAIIILTLTIPVAIGMAIKWKFPKYAHFIKQYGGILGLVAITVSAATLAGIYAKTWVIIWQFFFITLLLPPLGFLLGFVAGKLTQFLPKTWGIWRQSNGSCKAIALETGIQNTNLAVAIINLAPTFSETPCIQAEMAVMPLLYLCVQTLWAFIIIGSYKVYERRLSPEEKLARLNKNIEIAEDETADPIAVAAARRKSVVALNFGSKPAAISSAAVRNLSFQEDVIDVDALTTEEQMELAAKRAQSKLGQRRPTMFEKFNRNLITSTLGGVGGGFALVDPQVEKEIAGAAEPKERVYANGMRRRSVYISFADNKSLKTDDEKEAGSVTDV